jgi:hypothetical protein
MKNFVKGVLVIKVFSTFFRPEMVENETSKDVEGLSGVGETVGVVREKSGGVIFEFQGGFSKKHKRPGGREVAVGFPFDPNALVGFPGDLSPGAFEEAMLWGLFGARTTHLALLGETHELEPRAD